MCELDIGKMCLFVLIISEEDHKIHTNDLFGNLSYLELEKLVMFVDVIGGNVIIVLLRFD